MSCDEKVPIKMFLDQIDWKDPRFSKWNLRNLGELNEAQLNAFFDDDEIDFPAFTESELKELSLKYPCRVELFHSNVCHGVERSWPYRIFRRKTIHDLLPHQKRILIRTMTRDGVKLYNKYVDENRLKKRRTNRTNRTLASYYEERYLRHRYNRIKALGDSEHQMSDSECSVTTVINTKDIGSDSYASNRSGKNRSRKSTNNNSSDVELEKDCRIVYDQSSDDDFESCASMAEVTDNSRKQKKTAKNPSISSPNQDSDKSTNSTPFTTPLKSPNGLISANTPAIDKLRLLRTNLFHNNSPDDDLFHLEHDDFDTGDGGIAMLVEVTNEHRINITRTNAIPNIEISDDSSSSDRESVLIIDESFDYLVSNSTVPSTIVQNNSVDDIESLSCATPQINSDDLIPINAIDIRKLRTTIDDSLDLFLSPLYPTSIQEQAMNPL